MACHNPSPREEHGRPFQGHEPAVGAESMAKAAGEGRGVGGTP